MQSLPEIIHLKNTPHPPGYWKVPPLTQQKDLAPVWKKFIVLKNNLFFSDWRQIPLLLYVTLVMPM